MAPEIAAGAAAFAAFLVALGVIWRNFVGPAIRFVRASLVRVRVVHELIEKELNPNGGSSLKDQSERIERRLAGVTEAVVALQRSATGTEERVERLETLVTDKIDEHDRIWQAVSHLAARTRDDDDTPPQGYPRGPAGKRSRGM